MDGYDALLTKLLMVNWRVPSLVNPDISANSIEAAGLRREVKRRVKIIRPPSFSPLKLLSSLSVLVQYRDLLLTLSAHRVKVRYKQSILGIFWAILQPFSLMLIYTVIFSLVARMPSDGAPYAVFSYIALLPWTYFSTCVTNSTGGLVSHAQLVTKVYFPREILPLSYVVAALFDFLVASSVLAGLLFYYRVHLTINALYAVPIIMVLTLFATSVALFLSATQVRFRDIGVAVPLLLQIWMFVSPVVYPLSAVPAQWRNLYLLNPMAGLIENFRRTILLGTAPDFYSLGISTLIAIILLPAAYIYFKHFEATVADII
ncbi:MAG: lipopolysaccharide transport system permease protein [Acidobacteriota bacterium]|jgi:lipopolysaccharide transport system permease protein|nr:lipopolysaccharide transport system permease protein [Acidobacteriota bacterium]